ncbi:EAL domain-containing protein [Vibrio parahaemolyticus]|uniref:EAL domain-containing protein n=1 Tax=Vibrio parahaemolyticus TaxID=670 RepID=UPI00215C08E7|nr:EAL domain-containing protein [Vibrio parahaemolyticus]
MKGKQSKWAYFVFYATPAAFILLTVVSISYISINETIKTIGDTYIEKYEEILQEVIVENRSALLSPSDCEALHRNLRYERDIDEMQIIHSRKVVCSSKHKASYSNPLLTQISSKSTMITILPIPNTFDVSIAIANHAIYDGMEYYAVSLINRDYMRSTLGYRSDPRIKSAVLVIDEMTAPAGSDIAQGLFVYSAVSNIFGHQIIISASHDLIENRVLFYLFSAFPASFVTYLLIYLARNHFSSQRGIYNEILKGLKRGEFILNYQTQVNGSKRDIFGLEVLVRWQHPEKGLLYPDVFIPIMEEFGLINELTTYVLSRASEDFECRIQDNPIHLGINFPPCYFSQHEHLAIIIKHNEKLRKLGVKLGLEITERQFLDKKASQRINYLRENGLEVLIDDFGTGQTSLSVLQKTSIDYLKIDKCFVDTIGSDSVNTPVLDAIITLAKGLDVGLIAEGVEYQEQADYLIDRGVLLHQGYLYSKPRPLEEIKLSSH